MPAACRFVSLVTALFLAATVPLHAQPAGTPVEGTVPPVDLHLNGTLDVTTFAAFDAEHRVAPRGVLDVTATADLGRLAHLREEVANVGLQPRLRRRAAPA